LEIQSDRGCNLTSKIFELIIKSLSIKHYISAPRAPRSNGEAEAQVKRFSELVKRPCDCDTQIENVLSIIEFILNTTPQAEMR